MELTPQQKQAVTVSGRDVLVSAAAGSGKTGVLVERLVNACENGSRIDDFLVITYTRAAAGELRGRIQKRLAGSPERARLHRAKIGTIHAFCSKLIRENAVECGVRPDFKQLEGERESALKAKALAAALETLYAESPPGFAALAESLSDTAGDGRLGEVILSVYNALRAHPSPEIWMDEQLEAMRNGETPWMDYLIRDADRALDFAGKMMSKARAELRRHAELDAAYGAAFDGDLENIAILKHDKNAVIQHKRLGAAKPLTDEAQRFKDIRADYKTLTGFGIRDLTEEERENALDTARGVFTAVRVFGAAYAELKERENALDFSDLEHTARALLQTKRDIKFREILVDEYQDVNRVQEDIIFSLGAPVFMVGDARQSVYGFRQADPDIFLGKYESWADGNGGERVILPHNFRSKPMLLNAVNAVFSKITIGMKYGEDELLRPAPGADLSDKTPLASLVYRDRADTGDEGLSRAELEARMCADICAREIERGSLDIAVLMRSKSNMGLFRHELARRGLPVLCQEDGVYDTLEMRTALACLQILDNPRQDIPLLAVMRSPLYNFSPGDLTAARSASSGDFYDALLASAESGNSKCAALLDDLVFLRDAGGDDGADTVYHAMLERLGLLELFGAMPGGNIRRDNLLSVIPIAAGCETVSALRETLERLRGGGAAREGTAAAGRGIALMTMHKSKGLEFETVIAADLAGEFNRTDERKPVLFHKELGLGLKFTDAERRFQYSTPARDAVARRINEDSLREETRLLYVALTRAKERLFVTLTVSDMEKRLKKLAAGLDGTPHEYRLLSAKNMADWMILALMRNGRLDSTDAWMIEKWEAGCQSPARETAAPPVPSGETVSSGVSPSAHRGGDLQLPARTPSKITVTELNPPPELPPVFAKPRFMEKHTRMSAAGRGTALHTVMQFADFAKCLTLDGAAAEIQRMAREFRVTPEQADAADPAAVRGFAVSPLGRRVLKAPEVKREFAFSLLTPAIPLLGGAVSPGAETDEKILLQGVIDLMFYEDGGWVIVDFKTNASGRKSHAAAAAMYKPQLEAYSEAVRRVTGENPRQRLIYLLDEQIEIEV